MKELLLVFVGGGLGSSLRYWIAILINSQGIKWIPTLSVNVMGCLLLGLIIGLWHRENISETWFLLLGIGFCGGLTTFSTFGAELFQLLKAGDIAQASGYLVASIVLGTLVLSISYFGVQRLI
ncbi:fluoride efflux transporter CrcB [Nonlabens xiamenensis]|uniref:fluoride efflux transporter CrcB n=1 Tax=Nonlabens xiamenensis TaxID=2341043 RepID=UPI000F61461D|nr:fluoride efflux transporter CrcB [Nonlabens xiamenensis]